MYIYSEGHRMTMPAFLLLLFVSSSLICQCDCACTLPFTGTWVTSSRGTWTVDSGSIQNFKLTVDTSGTSLYQMDCLESDGTYYVLKSNTTFFPFTTVETYIFACISFSKQSDNKYLFYMNSVTFEVTTSVYERVKLRSTSASDFTLSEACDDQTTNISQTSVALQSALFQVTTAVYERLILRHVSAASPALNEVCTDFNSTQERVHVALQSGFETSAVENCPTTIQSTWSYAQSTCNGTLETCNDRTKFAYNDTACDNPHFSADGILYCVYSGTSGSETYVTLYNADTTAISNPTSFQFTCMIYSVDGTSIKATVNPEECQPTQTSTTISSTYGVTVTYTDISTSDCNATTSEETDLTWLYILIAVLVVLIIIAIIIILICCLYRRQKRKTKADDEEQQRITEDTESDKSSTKGVEEPDEVIKHSDDVDKTSVDSGFIPDKQEEQEKIITVNESDTKQEEEVQVDEEGEKDGDKQRPSTVVSRMSDLGSTLAPSEQVDGVTPEPDQEEFKEELDKNDDTVPPKKESQSDETFASKEPEQEEEQPEEDKKSEAEEKKDENKDEESTEETNASEPESEDPEEVERKIRQIGMKKSGPDYVPEGQLSKVLVTRDMHEKKRSDKEKRKNKRGLGLFVKGKSKGKTGRKEDGAGTPDSLEEETLQGKGGPKAEFMEQYQQKKKIEKKLNEEHYWSVDDGIDQFKLEDYDEEFEECFQEQEEEESKMVVDDNVEKTEVENIVAEKDGEKDSGNESPGLQKETTQFEEENEANIDSDPDMRDVEDEDVEIDDVYIRGTSDLPPGFIRDTEGRIIRLSDGQIITEDEMERYFKKARVKRIFNIKRLKRNKKGRPTGGYVQDEFGPEVEEIQKEDIKDTDSEDGPKPKQARSATDRQGTAEQKHRKSLPKVDNSGMKSVAFNVADESFDETFVIKDDESDPKKKGRRDLSTPNRELLKKRLFKSKKKRDPQSNIIYVSESEKPRELNSLVKVYRPGPGGQVTSRSLLPPPNLVRSESGRSTLDPSQLQRYRQGLANDRKFLERQGSERRVREAFAPNDLEIEEIPMEEDKSRNQPIDIGDEDEFVLVGNGGPSKQDTQLEPFFTIVRRNDKRHDESGIPWCTRHELRHTIPWSLREPSTLSRANTTMNDGRDQMRVNGEVKSADASKRRDIEDWRLKILLEELYKDKKYFDHVIDSTDGREKDPVLDERDLAEHGRGYLLDRAEYWDQQIRDNPIPLPPWVVPTRMNTSMKLDSGRASQTSTMTPPIIEQSPRPNTVPNREQTFS